MPIVEDVHVATDARQDVDLAYLEIPRNLKASSASMLSGLRAIVIGAGPSGLIFAREASMQGADVTVIEQAGDPRVDDAGYTNRSYNITLVNVGRQVLADSRAWEGGIWLQGRAIHDPTSTDNVAYSTYGPSSDYDYVSVPRPVLRRNLCTLAEEAGAKLLFNSEVVSADVEGGMVSFTDRNGAVRKLGGDLIVFGDGSRSIADRLKRESGIDDVQISRERKQYICGSIPDAFKGGLSMRHIHLWHESQSENFSLGIPNLDGSISLLIASPFDDVEPGEHPFKTVSSAKKRLQREFPHLHGVAPMLVSELPSRTVGQFYYKSVSDHFVGSRGVIIGDAGGIFPPWAGFGANSAMYAGASLVYMLQTNQGSVKQAVQAFHERQLLLADKLAAFAEGQSEFLANGVKANPGGRSETALALFIADVVSAKKTPKTAKQSVAA